MVQKSSPKEPFAYNTTTMRPVQFVLGSIQDVDHHLKPLQGPGTAFLQTSISCSIYSINSRSGSMDSLYVPSLKGMSYLKIKEVNYQLLSR